MDALDQIGDTVIASIKAYFAESHNRGIVERLTKKSPSSMPKSRKSIRRSPARPSSSRARWRR